MKVIYKYPIQYNSENHTVEIEVPKGAKVISALNLDADTMAGYIYAIVDPTLIPSVKREVLWFGTGIPIMDEQEEKIEGEGFQFLGTFRDDYGPYVWHLWVEKEQEEVELDTMEFEADRFRVDIDPETHQILKINRY